MLTAREGAHLVRTTREGVEAHLTGDKDYSPGEKDGSPLWKNQGVFVTLKEAKLGTLRGCIGNPYPERPLVIEAVQSGVLAATADPRFEPLTLPEMREKICFELTVLSSMIEMKEQAVDQRARGIQIGRDGLMVDGYGRKGLLLPQVAVEEGFDEEDFLASCCIKAGISADAWLSLGVRVYTFGGQIFSEISPGSTAAEVHLSNWRRIPH